MKKLALLIVSVGSLLGLGLTGGCASTAYTGSENVGRIARTWSIEANHGMDDFLFHAMFVPPSHSSLWNLR